MKKDYPLFCNFCKSEKKLSERRIYAIEISEILEDKTNSKYPHTSGDFRHLQICENCLNISDINKILVAGNRQF